MKNKLQAEYLSVSEAKTRDELEAEIVGFAKNLGFDTVSATVVIDHMTRATQFITVDNTPDAYLETFRDPENSRRNPVSQHCKAASVPLVWDQDHYVAAGQGHMWEHQAKFGYRCGIALAMHMPKGLHFMLAVDRDQALPSCAMEITRMTAALQLFAVHAQEAALRVLLPSTIEKGELPALTPRELECLRWTMEGKTAWELGRILGIAEQTAVRHIHNASKKLGCVNKHQAVLKALRLKIIW